MSNLDPRIEEVRAKYGLQRADFWELPQRKGTWLVKHAALEVVAARAGIQFDDPKVIESHSAEGIAALSVTGVLGDRREWATGEASPKNNRNAYPWAMAEKRAKDRVVLKLAGIHGLVYSEDEMSDDARAPAPAAPVSIPKISSYRAKQFFKVDVLLAEIDKASERGLKELEKAFAEDLSFLPASWISRFAERIDDRRKDLANEAEPDSDEHTEPTDPGAMLDRQFKDTIGDAA